MRASVERYRGTVLKFMGDALMVSFNVPVTQRYHALRAVYDEFTHHILLFPNNTGMDFEVAATAWKHRQRWISSGWRYRGASTHSRTSTTSPKR